jgi:hypothetical protein
VENRINIETIMARNIFMLFKFLSLVGFFYNI